MRVVIYIGGELVQEIFVRGSVYVLRDVVRTYVFFFFSSFIDTLFLHCDSKPCTYDDIYIYIYLYMYMIRLLLQFFHLSLHVLFIFSLYAHDSYILYAIFYFCFTIRCRDEFCLKCFRNTGCQSLLIMNSLLARFFKSLCQDRFYCIQQVNMS